MRKARQTTPEERLEIVKDCLANDRNYGAMALKHNCSYQQVRNWVLRYEKMGSAGLEDRLGRWAGTQIKSFGSTTGNNSAFQTMWALRATHMKSF